MAAIENEALIEVFMKSNKTLDEALEYLGSDAKAEKTDTQTSGWKKKENEQLKKPQKGFLSGTISDS